MQVQYIREMQSLNNSTHLSIYPGGLEFIPAAIVQEAGYTVDRLLVFCSANRQRQTTIHTHIHIDAYGQFRITS